MRRAAVVLPLLLLTACTSTVTGSATPAPTTGAPSSSSAGPTATSTPEESDDLTELRAQVDELYLGLFASSGSSLQSVVDYYVAHNHPQFAYTAAECLTFFQGLGYTDAYRLSYTPDVDAIAPDPGWQVPDGRYAGLVPDGETYLVPVEVRETDTGYAADFEADVHVTQLDGEVYFFQPCEQ